MLLLIVVVHFALNKPTIDRLIRPELMTYRKLIFLILTCLIHLPIKAQVIKGRLLDYYDNKSNSHVTVIANSTFDFSTNNALDRCISDNNGVFVLDSLKAQNKIHLIFQSVGVETLIVKDIILNTDTVNLGDIYLLQGSYRWEGECIKKYFWGLLKRTKGCSGKVTGIIEQNMDTDLLEIAYPKGQTKKRFMIKEKALIIDYKELKIN